jgi:hypothetical protein
MSLGRCPPNRQQAIRPVRRHAPEGRRLAHQQGGGRDLGGRFTADHRYGDSEDPSRGVERGLAQLQGRSRAHLRDRRRHHPNGATH